MNFEHLRRHFGPFRCRDALTQALGSYEAVPCVLRENLSTRSIHQAKMPSAFLARGHRILIGTKGRT